MPITSPDLDAPHAIPVSTGMFKRSMRSLAGAVCVVTVGSGNSRTGFTATSVISLTAERPTLLLTLNKGSSSWASFETEKRFCVNLLSEAQAQIARNFSGFDGRKGAERYETGDWSALPLGGSELGGPLPHSSARSRKSPPTRATGS